MLPLALLCTQQQYYKKDIVNLAGYLWKFLCAKFYLNCEFTIQSKLPYSNITPDLYFYWRYLPVNYVRYSTIDIAIFPLSFVFFSSKSRTSTHHSRECPTPYSYILINLCYTSKQILIWNNKSRKNYLYTYKKHENS